jgi:hypothetical protein
MARDRSPSVQRRVRAPRVNYDRIATLTQSRISVLLPKWLPGGEFKANTYVKSQHAQGSARVSVTVWSKTGSWHMQHVSERGNVVRYFTGDNPVSLFGRLYSLPRRQAAIRLAAQLHINPFYEVKS